MAFWNDWTPRDVDSTILLIAVCSIVMYDLVKDGSIDNVLAHILNTIVAFHYGSKSTNGNGKH